VDIVEIRLAVTVEREPEMAMTEQRTLI